MVGHAARLVSRTISKLPGVFPCARPPSPAAAPGRWPSPTRRPGAHPQNPCQVPRRRPATLRDGGDAGASRQGRMTRSSGRARRTMVGIVEVGVEVPSVLSIIRRASVIGRLAPGAVPSAAVAAECVRGNRVAAFAWTPLPRPPRHDAALLTGFRGWRLSLPLTPTTSICRSSPAGGGAEKLLVRTSGACRRDVERRPTTAPPGVHPEYPAARALRPPTRCQQTERLLPASLDDDHGRVRRAAVAARRHCATTSLALLNELDCSTAGRAAV